VDGSAFSLYGRPNTDPSIPLEKAAKPMGLKKWMKKPLLVGGLEPCNFIYFFPYIGNSNPN